MWLFKFTFTFWHTTVGYVDLYDVDFLGYLEIIEILSGWKKPKIPLNTLSVAVSWRESSALLALTLGCLFGNLLPFPGWFRDSPYKFIAWNILCSVRSLCWGGFWLLLPACSSHLSTFTDDAASPCCHSVFPALGLKGMCSETWIWCSHSVPV